MSSVPSGTAPTPELTTPEVPAEVESSKPPSYLPASDDVSGSVVSNDVQRIWYAAAHLQPQLVAIKRKAPPNEAAHRAVHQTSVAAQVTRVLRVHNADMTEQAWQQRARVQLPRTRYNYLAPLHYNLTEQFPVRYQLREGETWEANARYARSLETMKPILKGALQRARYCLAVDSTCKSDLPIDNLLLDVLVLSMPLSRFAEVAEMVGVMFDPNLRGSLKEPPVGSHGLRGYAARLGSSNERNQKTCKCSNPSEHCSRSHGGCRQDP